MKRIVLLFSLYLITSSIGYSQKVDKEWVETAMTYRLDYPDDDALMLSSHEKYSFEISYSDKNNPQVVAYKEVVEKYIALKENKNLAFGDGYDSYSEITKLFGNQNFGKDYKRTPFQINDREYVSDEIFDNDARYKYLILPLYSVGLRYLGGYTKKYSDVRYLTSSYFISKFPCLTKEIEIEIPMDLDLELREFNFEGYNIEKKISENTKKQIRTILYSISKVNGVASEINTPNLSKVYPHIVFVAKSFKDKHENKVQIFENTKDLYNWYKLLVAKIKDNDLDLQTVVNNLTKGKTTDIEKIKSIYYWVQDNIKYIAFERGIAGFQPDAASLVYKNKFGDCKGMANLLATLLKLAGFDARLTWIGTTDKNYNYSLPSIIVDNHMICALKLNGKYFFLDGTEKYIAFDDYAQRIQGRQALIEDGDNYIIESLPLLPIERNKYTENKIITIEGNNLKAKVSETFKGENQTNFLRAINDVPINKQDKILNKFLSKDDKNFEIVNISEKTFEKRESPIIFNYEVIISNNLTEYDKEVYLSIDFANDLEELITDEKRKNAIEVEENIFREYFTELEIPEGYVLKQLPNNLDISADHYSFDVKYTTDGKKVRLNKKILMKAHIQEHKNLTKWNLDLKKLKETNNEQIILQKL